MPLQITVPYEKIEAFCRKWKIKEFAIFGSAVTDEFRPDSDVDVLVVFHNDAQWSLFDLYKAETELKDIFGRSVDLVQKKSIRNPFRRRHILDHCEVLYAT